MEKDRLEAQMRKHFTVLHTGEVRAFVFDPQMQPKTRQIARDELVRRSKEKK